MNNKDKNKKMNKDNEALQAAMTSSVWKDLPPSAWKELKLEDFATPTAPLATLVVLGKALTDRIGPDATVGEKRSGKTLLSVCDLGGRAGEYNRLFDRRVVDTKPARLKVVRFSSCLFDMLTLQANSPLATVAETAAKLKTGIFGDDFRPGTYKSRLLHQRMCEVEGALRRNPSLRKALEGAVPAALVEEMLVAHRELEEQVRRRGEQTVIDPGVDLSLITSRVRQRTGEYVVNVLATVDIEDPETVARAMRLLSPLTELRAELTKERSVRARGAAGREAEAGAEEIEEAESAGEIESEDAEEEVASEPADPAPA